MTTRRDFIKSTCSACIGLSAAATFIESCAPLPVYKTVLVNNTLYVSIDSFSGDEKPKIIRTENLNYDVLLIKNDATTFTALKMECTHFNNQLTVTKNGLACNLHGSRFDLNGDVINGPASQPLKHYPTKIEGKQVLIFLS